MAAVMMDPERTVEASVHNSTWVADSARTPQCPTIQHNDSNNPIQRIPE
jgi:hypothetical protein